MKFLDASALWWLIPILGVIVLLYLMKMRRQELRVPATFLWPQITSDVRANAPMQKLRISLLLILQLLAALLIVAALADPLHAVRGLAGSATIIVLDNSASMNATDVAPSRFAEAEKRVEGIIDQMNRGDRLALIDAGASTHIVFPLTGDKSAMREGLRTLAPSDSQSTMADALRLAASLATGRPSAKIVVLSDGDFPPVVDFSPGRAQIVYAPIGTSRKNVAITAFNSSLLPSGAIQCFVSLHNYDAAPVAATVAFKVDGDLVDVRKVRIAGAPDSTLTFDAPRTAKTAEATVNAPGDILASDNDAITYLQGSATIRTLLVSNGDLFLQRALSLNPVVRLDMTSSVPDDERIGSSGSGSYDLVVFDNTPPVPVKAPGVWSLGIPGSQFGVADSGMTSRPTVVDWAHEDPVMRYAEFRGILIERAHSVRPIPGAATKTLATGSAGPLVVSNQTGGRRALYCAWNILDSDFPLRVSFPVFASNAVSWLTQGAAGSGGKTVNVAVRPGQPFSVILPGGAATVTHPDGSTTHLDAPTGSAIVHGLDQVGEYRIAGSQADIHVAVNLLDEQASDVTPRQTLTLSTTSVPASKTRGVSLAELWRLLAIAVLCLLAAEWWVFVRRS